MKKCWIPSPNRAAFLFAFPVFVFIAPARLDAQQPPVAPISTSDSGGTQAVAPGLSVSIIPAFEGTYGYDILRDGKVFIHQPNIPAVPGNRGFSSAEKARKCAELVVDKLKANRMPPSVTPAELEALDLLN